MRLLQCTILSLRTYIARCDRMSAGARNGAGVRKDEDHVAQYQYDSTAASAAGGAIATPFASCRGFRAAS